MSVSPSYVPVLRWKYGERQALKRLGDDVIDCVLPLVEFPDRDCLSKPKREKSALLLIREFVAEMEECWADRRLLLDLSHFRSDGDLGVHCVTAVFDGAVGRALRVVPVVHVNSEAAYLKAVADVVRRDRSGASIRLTSDDIAQTGLKVALSKVLATIGASPESVDCVVDLGAISKVYDAGSICDSVPLIGLWRSFAIVAGAFPKDLTGMDIGKHRIPRHDWTSWKLGSAQNLRRHPTYGDYATLHPILIPTNVPLNASASIRYTCEDDWIVMRGEGLRNEGGAGHAQYPANAQLLSLLPEYCGSGYSYGDHYIHKVGVLKQGPGNPTTWLRAAVNHHITLAVRQVASFHASLGKHRRSSEAVPKSMRRPARSKSRA